MLHFFWDISGSVPNNGTTSEKVRRVSCLGWIVFFLYSCREPSEAPITFDADSFLNYFDKILGKLQCDICFHFEAVRSMAVARALTHWISQKTKISFQAWIIFNLELLLYWMILQDNG